MHQSAPAIPARARQWLRRFLLALLLMAALTAATGAWMLWRPLPAPPVVALDGDFLISNVSIVDVEADELRANQDVLVRNGVIAGITATAEENNAAGLTVIDGSDRYLLPGLWDMHTHSMKVSAQYQHPLFIANGVTGVREMWGCMSEPDPFIACIEDRERWNASLAAGESLSPRYIRHGSYSVNDGSEVPAGFPDFFRASTPAQIEELVGYYAGSGADFLKTYTQLPNTTYRYLAKEARRLGLSLEGHRPAGISLEELITSGQRSIEHPRVFLFECFAGAEDFRSLPDPYSAYNLDLRVRMVDDHEPANCRHKMQRLADSDTWWVPTLQVLRMNAFARDEHFRDDPRLQYIPYLLRRFMWMPDVDGNARNALDANGRNIYTQMYRMALSQVGAAQQLGVKLLAGTDAGDSYVFPGFSIHDELALLVESGLSPAEALRTATTEAARFSDMEARYGEIAEGKAADLLLLAGNPLEDIHNTRDITGVWLDGRYIDRDGLDELLAFAAQQAGSLQTNLHLLRAAIGSPLMRTQIAD